MVRKWRDGHFKQVTACPKKHRSLKKYNNAVTKKSTRQYHQQKI